MDVHGSARKHGVDERDIRHAVEHAMVIEELDDDACLFLGPSRNGAPLEAVALIRDDGSLLVIHAMPMRAKYQALLPGETP
ncbi:MAG TPA: DUF4258 domain-containing protein [Acidimicrobiia bacterium]|nr:DUF4258 domain-containing protein [Acidimicrobiia bacterium]